MTQEEFQTLLPGLAANYQSAPGTLAQIGNASMLLIIGPSGVGKTSLIKRLSLPYVAADTTRLIRPDEQEGVDYNFRLDYEQIIKEIKNGSFIQIAVGPVGDLYASKASSYPQEGIAVGAIVADVVPLFRELGFKETISVFITPPSYAEWMRRLKSHPVTKEQLAKRFAEAKRSFDFALTDEDTHFILNDDLEKATIQIKELLRAQPDIDREKQARQAAQAIRDSIN